MATIHRLQWIDAEIRADRYPNTKSLAERFEISRRQALRDFEYLRDSLGAPLEYSAKYHGYYYTSDTYILPGPFVTEEERRLLNHLQSYYSKAALDDAPGSGAYVQVANLMQKLGGITREAPASKDTLPERGTWEMPSPYQATLELPMHLSQRSVGVLEPYVVSRQAGAIVCEFREWEQFLDLLLGIRETVHVQWPTWLRERLIERLNDWLQRQQEPVSRPESSEDDLSVGRALPNREELGMTATSQPTALVPRISRPFLSEAPARRMVEVTMTRSNNSYLGALYGVLKAADMCDLEFDIFAAQ
ncbi:MAG: helix-turn-helix transcriptional regulator, partial [Bacillota bacterium]